MRYQAIAIPECGMHLYESKHKDDEIVSDHHHQVHQILYAVEGEGSIMLNGSRLRIEQDNAAVIVPYSNHSILSSPGLTLLVLAFRETVLEPEARRELLHQQFPQSELVRLNPFAGSELRQRLRKMVYEQSHTQDDALGVWALKIHLLDLLLMLSRSSRQTTIADANGLRAERIRAYIDTRYYEPITSGDIAGKLGISARHVNNIFKEQFHTTPMQYLTEVRIRQAQAQLEGTSKDIVTICFEVGYDALSTFYRSFKNVVGVSPHKYRQTLQTRDYAKTEEGNGQ